MKIDSSEFERTAKRELDRLAENVMQEVIKAGNEVRNDAIKKTPVDTGSLRAGWKIRVERMGKGGKVTVSNETSYARSVEYGTKPHTIRAKSKSVLANRKTGSFFGKTVNHPGTRPNPMLGPAIRNVIPKLTARLRGLK